MRFLRAYPRNTEQTGLQIMNLQAKMKSCPFCGGKATALRSVSNNYYPRCSTEKCVGNQGWVSFSTEEKAVEAWNKRVLLIQDKKQDKKKVKKHRRLFNLDLGE
jgi:hypothetical protein